jgi:hypothetical protein
MWFPFSGLCLMLQHCFVCFLWGSWYLLAFVWKFNFSHWCFFVFIWQNRLIFKFFKFEIRHVCQKIWSVCTLIWQKTKWHHFVRWSPGVSYNYPHSYAAEVAIFKKQAIFEK